MDADSGGLLYEPPPPPPPSPLQPPTATETNKQPCMTDVLLGITDCDCWGMGLPGEVGHELCVMNFLASFDSVGPSS